MNSLSKAVNVLHYLGPGFVARRLALSLEGRLGFTRRAFAPRPWETIALRDILIPGTPTEAAEYAAFKQANPPRFLFPLGSPPAIPPDLAGPSPGRSPGLVERLELLRADRCVYFFNQPSPEPIDWYHNPFDDTRGDDRRTWCDIPDFHPSQGDPRVLWEPSRAAWALDLARAAGRGMDYPGSAVFWKWVDSWMAACPPFVGFQWKCGQESAVRFMAIAVGFWATFGNPERSPHRWAQFAGLAWATGYRIAKHIRYAISQNNNHSLSEACGLLLIAHLFPELREAEHWSDLGRRVLTAGLVRQIAPDGSYVQHSMNYHRVMLHVSVLTLRLGELAERPFGRDLYDRIGRATAFLYQMMDPTAGRAPNYGNNDGACVLPLTECDFRDYRPVVQSGHYLVHRKRLLEPGPWDEEMVWLFGSQAAQSSSAGSVQRESTDFLDGGYSTIRRSSSWAMIRCHDYRSRPGQYDPLHVDLWWDGINILCDRGTYRYYNPGDRSLEVGFRSLTAHNGIAIDGDSPGEWVSRFLLLPFPRARRIRNPNAFASPLRVFEGASYDYARSPWRVVHRRTLLSLAADLWVIVDDLTGPGTHDVTLRWQLPPFPYELFPAAGQVVLQTSEGPATLSMVASPCRDLAISVAFGRNEHGRCVGHSAPYYNSLVPAPTVEATLHSRLPLRLLTTVHLGRSGKVLGSEESGDVQAWRVQHSQEVWSLALATHVSQDRPVFLRADHAPNRSTVGR